MAAGGGAGCGGASAGRGDEASRPPLVRASGAGNAGLPVAAAEPAAPTPAEEALDPWLRCSPTERAARRAELEALAERVGRRGGEAAAGGGGVKDAGKDPRTTTATTIDAQAVLAELHALVARPCLMHVALAAPLPATTDAAELMVAAQRGLFAALALTTKFTRSDRHRYLVLPPELGPALDEDERQQLAPWRCGSGPAATVSSAAQSLASCERGDAYQRRGVAAFDAEEQGWAQRYQVQGAPVGFFALPASECDGTFPRDDAPSSFEAWVACVATRTPRTAHYAVGLPLRAPDRGWLIVRGRRGHYQFSDEVRAYDLATGAAYVTRREGVLFSKDGKITPDSFAGRAEPEAIRELAFLLLTRPALTELRRSSFLAELPGNLPLRTAGEPPPFTTNVPAHKVRNSSQTTLDFAYFDGELRQYGSFLFPYGDPFDNRAVALLAEVEKSQAATCAPARLPPTFALRSRDGVVSPLDASPQHRGATAAALDRQLDGLRSRACKGAR